MGADNWGKCPRCIKRAEKAFVKRAEDVAKQYGRVPPAEFMRLSTEAAVRPPLAETLREDYEMGTDKAGLFSVSYGCTCSVCGFKHTFKHEEQL